jgi:hypothetical protein
LHGGQDLPHVAHFGFAAHETRELCRKMLGGNGFTRTQWRELVYTICNSSLSPPAAALCRFESCRGHSASSQLTGWILKWRVKAMRLTCDYGGRVASPSKHGVVLNYSSRAWRALPHVDGAG